MSISDLYLGIDEPTIGETPISELDDPLQLVSLLSERSEVYENCSARESNRIRSAVLIRLSEFELPESALPNVLEQLELGHEPRSVAAAAIALRSLPFKHAEFAKSLLKGLRNLKGHDDYFHFRLADTNSSFKTTAQAELTRTIRWLGDNAAEDAGNIRELGVQDWHGLQSSTRRELVQIAENLGRVRPPKVKASCCSSLRRDGADYSKIDSSAYLETAVQDQDGKSGKFLEQIRDRPTVLAFFYTRCENPFKCSLTIAKLAELQNLITESGLDANLVAVTYDPAYDLPYRMKLFGTERGFVFDENSVFLRIDGSHEEFIDSLNLQVSYLGSAVSHHASELFILDHGGQVIDSFSRTDWSPRDIHDAISNLPSDSKTTVLPVINSIMGFGSALLFALMPKCPLCWASWLSLFGITTTGFVSQKIVLSIASVCLATFLAVCWWRYWRSGRLLPFCVSVLAAVGITIAMVFELGWGFRLVCLVGLVFGSCSSSGIHIPIEAIWPARKSR